MKGGKSMDKELKEILLKHEERITKLEEIARETKEQLKITNKTVTQHTSILEKHEKTLNEHTKILDEHTQMLQSLQKSVAIIEDAVTNKIPALFDGYKMHQEAQERLEKRVNKVEKIAEMNAIRILALEDKNNQKAKLTS